MPPSEKGDKTMEKIKMQNPVVEMDGDEMTRILWKCIKDELICPFVELNTEYYDLGLSNRDATKDKITVDAANAIKKWHVGVKCATITPNAKRVEEYKLHKMWKSPNGTIRSILDGTVFRTPILVDCISSAVRNWKKPITVARHAYGDIYKAVEYKVPAAGTAELVFTDSNGRETYRSTIHEFDGAGVILGQHNTEKSIASFARSCFEFALSEGKDLWFAAKDTISKEYDGRFREVFNGIFESEYKAKFENAGIKYFYTLIDDAVARVMRSEGGFVWACKNYDGDVMSDMLSAAFGSLAMMTSVLVSPDGNYEFEAAHGTITRHYYRYLKGEETSSNPVAMIFAWAGALSKRGELDGNEKLFSFGEKLKAATLETINSGVMTGDLAALCDDDSVHGIGYAEFLASVREKL